MNTRKKISKLCFYILIIFLLILVLFPIYWIFVTSFKTPIEAISPIPTLFPQSFTLQNYLNVISAGFFKNMFNSLFIALISTLFSLFLSTLASYSLVRYKFPFYGNSLFMIWILLVKILPPVVLAVPLYNIFIKFHLINTHLGLILVYQVYTLPYCIWMIFGFIKALPVTFEEAALIDGASRWYTLKNIVIPLVRTGIVATSIFSIISAWDEFLFALLFIRTPSLQTLPLVIVNYIGEYETLWGELMAIGVLTTLPIFLFANFIHKYYTTGFSMSLK